MNTWPGTIVKREVKKGQRGEYLEITILGEDGKTRNKKVFGKAATDIPCLGSYDIEYEKDGNFWNISGAKLLVADEPHGKADGEGRKEAPLAGKSRPLDDNETYRNDAITAQVCIKAATDITIVAISKALDPLLVVNAQQYVTKLAEALIVSSTVAHVKKDSLGPEEEEPPF